LESELKVKDSKVSSLQALIQAGTGEISSLLKNLESISSVLSLDLIKDSNEVTDSLNTTEKKRSRASYNPPL
jgi:hypothetical protein